MPRAMPATPGESGEGAPCSLDGEIKQPCKNQVMSIWQRRKQGSEMGASLMCQPRADKSPEASWEVRRPARSGAAAGCRLGVGRRGGEKSAKVRALGAGLLSSTVHRSRSSKCRFSFSGCGRGPGSCMSSHVPGEPVLLSRVCGETNSDGPAMPQPVNQNLAAWWGHRHLCSKSPCSDSTMQASWRTTVVQHSGL